MAGNYPDVPSWRIPYDRDGTVGLQIDAANVVSQMTQANLQTVNDESTSALAQNTDPARTCLIFPRLMDIDGGFWQATGFSGTGLKQFMWSPDTTNGIDGTWNSFSVPSGSNQYNAGAVAPNYRESIWSSTLGGVRGLRWKNANETGIGGAQLVTVHLFGEPTAGEDLNRLEFWHPTLNQRIGPAFFDWGNVPRSSSEDRQFRVKNLSSTLTANNIRLSFEALTDTTPSVPGQHTLSSDGTNFFAQRTITSLSPGNISAIHTVRRVTPSTAVFSLWALRLKAEVQGGWS